MPHYIKDLQVRNLRDHFKLLVRPSRALRILLNEEAFRRAGFAIPRTRFVAEVYTAGFPLRSVHASEAINDAISLADWLASHDEGPAPTGVEKRTLVGALASEVARMHKSGLYHGDMNLNNIFCRQEAEGFRFIWIDHERTRRLRVLPERLRIRNLAQLNREKRWLSRSDRLYFYRAYEKATNLQARESKALLKRTLKRHRRKERRYEN